MSEFSERSFWKAIRDETDMRVSKEAGITLRADVRSYADEIIDEALKILEEKERKTLRADEIKKAIRKIKKGK